MKRYLRNKLQPGLFAQIPNIVSKDFKSTLLPSAWKNHVSTTGKLFCKYDTPTLKLSSLSFNKRRGLADHRVVYTDGIKESFGEIICFAEEFQEDYAFLIFFKSSPYLKLDSNCCFFAELTETNSVVKVPIKNIVYKFILITVKARSGFALYGSKLTEEFEHS